MKSQNCLTYQSQGNLQRHCKQLINWACERMNSSLKKFEMFLFLEFSVRFFILGTVHI